MSKGKFGRDIGDEGYRACDIASYRDEISTLGLAINFGSLVGHGRLRTCVMDDPASAIPIKIELDGMGQCLHSSLTKGAFGCRWG
jgi:N-acyl-D-aspartate/D-glutamate deacylase